MRLARGRLTTDWASVLAFPSVAAGRWEEENDGGRSKNAACPLLLRGSQPRAFPPREKRPRLKHLLTAGRAPDSALPTTPPTWTGMPVDHPKASARRRHHRRDADDGEIDAGPSREVELKRSRGEISCAECRRCVRPRSSALVNGHYMLIAPIRLKIKCDKQIPCQSCQVRPLLNLGALSLCADAPLPAAGLRCPLSEW
jgi:hypothetical protein